MVETQRNGANVRRFHTVPLLNPETVGHHSGNVVALCYFLTRGGASAELLMAALFHDIAEQFTGDVPSPAKWSSKAFAKSLEKVEEWFATTNGFWHIFAALKEEEREILKAADMLDLVLKCKEEIALGNQNMEGPKKNGIEYLRGLHLPSGAARLVRSLLDEDESK